MNKKKIILITTILFSTSFAHAINYVQSKGGAINTIDEAAFKACEKIIFRDVAKDELPAEYKRKVLNALLKGDAINDAKAASIALKATDGTCSYSDKNDLK